MPTAAQALRHRRDLAQLETVLGRDLRTWFARFDTADAARDALLEVVPRLYALYAAAAATLAADWYDEVREGDGVRSRFRAVPAEVDPERAGLPELVRWGLSPLFQAEPDPASARSLVEGGLQRRIADASRTTITGSAVADPAAEGWQRVGSGECAFCAMLIGRGAVYSEAGADFASHDHCGCSAVPAFGGQPRPVKPYTPSLRNVSDADRVRAQQWMRDNS